MSDTGKRASDDSKLPTPKKFKPDYKEAITVIVGADDEKYLAYKDTVCAVSGYFKAACSTDWIEGQNGIVRITDTKPHLFWAFLHWANTGAVDLPPLLPDNFPSWLDYGNLWALGDYLQCCAIRNAIIDSMIRKMGDHPGLGISTPTVKEIFDKTPVNNTIQNLIADYAAATITRKQIRDGVMENLPDYVVRRMASRYHAKGKEGVPEPSFKQRCQYHEHEEGTSRCSSN